MLATQPLVQGCLLRTLVGSAPQCRCGFHRGQQDRLVGWDSFARRYIGSVNTTLRNHSTFFENTRCIGRHAAPIASNPSQNSGLPNTRSIHSVSLASASTCRPMEASDATIAPMRPTIAPHRNALWRMTELWRRTPVSPVDMIWISATAVVPKPKTSAQRAPKLRRCHAPGVSVDRLVSNCHEAFEVRSNIENPASAVKPDASCCSVVNAKPTPAVIGMTTAFELALMIFANAHGVTVSLPGPHSYDSQMITPTSAKRCRHWDSRKSVRIAERRVDRSIRCVWRSLPPGESGAL